MIGLIFKIIELIFKIIGLIFKIIRLIFKISGNIFKIMEIIFKINEHIRIHDNICHPILYIKQKCIYHTTVCTIKLHNRLTLSFTLQLG